MSEDNTSPQQKSLVENEHIKKIARRINKIKEKSMLIAIINIIKTMNPSVVITENENGMFIKFNSLTPETYVKLENYIHKNMLKHVSDDSEQYTTSEYIPYSPDDMGTQYDKYKLSNKERTLIKKQKYANNFRDTSFG